MNSIPYGKHSISQEDINAVIKILQSDFLTQGPAIGEFEKTFAEYIGCDYAVAVSNGTAALHLCALALGVDENTNVITTPITFAASANCIKFCGGNIHFADIDPLSYCLNIDHVEALINSKPVGFFQGLIPVDFAGYPVNLELFRRLADKYNLWIIEDACHAPGGYFVNSKGTFINCGNASYADMSVFSFHPVKHIATGEGGMITTNNADLYKKLLMLRTHGIVRDNNVFINSMEFANGKKDIDSYPGWYMEMQELGYNYRLTDFQAVLGISQLTRAEKGIAKRKEIALTYNDAFTGQPFIKGQSGFVEGHAYHLYVIEIEERLGLYNYLRENDIFAQIHYIPCHLMPYYKNLGSKEGDFPFAEKYYKHCISLPMYPTLTDEEQTLVIELIFRFYGNKA